MSTPSRWLRFFVSNRIDLSHSVHDFQIHGPTQNGRWPAKIGSNPANEIILNDPRVAPLAAAIVVHGDELWLEVFARPCQLGGRDLGVGRHRLVAGQELTIGAFTVVVDDLDGSGDGDRTHLDCETADLVTRLHSRLLRHLPDTTPQTGESRQDRDEKLLDIEKMIESIAQSLLVESSPPIRDHLAGLAVRSALLQEILRTSHRQGLTPGGELPPWSRMVSTIPVLERDLSRLIDRTAQSTGAGPSQPVRDRVRNVERQFWTVWQAQLLGSLDEKTRLYLATRQLKKEVKDLVFGLGPLQDLLQMPTITEIMVNGPDQIIVEHDGVLKDSGRRFVSADLARATIERIVSRVGRRVDQSSPMVDARLPDGSRVNAVIAPVAIRGPYLTVRKFSDRSVTLDDLIALGSLSPASARFLEAAVRARRNILVSGGTSSGKTTFLNCLADAIPDTERIITVEDTAELRLKHHHVVAMETKNDNREGRGASKFCDLVRNALRMRPDRVIVGECRGAEALDMLQAMNTGHDGSLTTVHANSPADVLGRLEVMVRQAVDLPSVAIAQQIASAIDLVVQLAHLPGERRAVVEITELYGNPRLGEPIRIRPLFDLDRQTGRLEPTGALPSFIEDLVNIGGLPIQTFWH